MVRKKAFKENGTTISSWMPIPVFNWFSCLIFLTANAEPMQSNRHRDSVRPQVHKQNSEHKPTRVRTVLNEKQLATLRTCYNNNPRPDALMKEQLVDMTGLSPRVIRVWFQNKRCKDKKKSILMKQMQQQEKVRTNTQIRTRNPLQLGPVFLCPREDN